MKKTLFTILFLIVTVNPIAQDQGDDILTKAFLSSDTEIPNVELLNNEESLFKINYFVFNFGHANSLYDENFCKHISKYLIQIVFHNQKFLISNEDNQNLEKLVCENISNITMSKKSNFFIDLDKKFTGIKNNVDSMNDLIKKTKYNEDEIFNNETISYDFIDSDKIIKNYENIFKYEYAYQKIVYKKNNDIESFKKEFISKNQVEIPYNYFYKAYLLAVDPHSNQLDKIESSEFFSNTFVNKAIFGFNYLYKENKIIIKGVEANSSAEESKLLPGDEVVFVKDQNKNKLCDVDCIKLMYSKQFSELENIYLTVSRGEETIDIPLYRKKIENTSLFCSSKIYNISNKKIGYIYIPSFYKFNNGHSTSSDLYKILLSMDSEDVEQIVIDLSNNTGGSLDEAIDSVSMFLEKGPILIQKNFLHKDNISVLSTTPVFDNYKFKKPVSIFINELSASASEIFTSAMKTYDRAIIFGNSTSIGKGSVQMPISLTPRDPDSDKLILTIALYYNPDGTSIQKKGVIPDVSFKGIDVQDESFYAESKYINPIENNPIESLIFNKKDRNLKKIEKMKNDFFAYLDNNTEYNLFLKEKTELKNIEKSTQILSESLISEEKKKREKQINFFENYFYNYKSNITYSNVINKDIELNVYLKLVMQFLADKDYSSKVENASL